MSPIKIDGTDDELNAAVAEHVAKLAPGFYLMKRGYYYRPNAAGYTSRTDDAGIYSFEETKRHVAGAGQPDAVTAHPIPTPPFATSVDAVLPLLAKYQWSATSMGFSGDWPGYKDVEVSIFDSRTNVVHKIFVHGKDAQKNFARAACFALLQRCGVKIITP